MVQNWSLDYRALLFTLQGTAECHHTGKFGLNEIPYFLELQLIIFLGELTWSLRQAKSSDRLLMAREMVLAAAILTLLQ